MPSICNESVYVCTLFTGIGVGEPVDIGCGVGDGVGGAVASGVGGTVGSGVGVGGSGVLVGGTVGVGVGCGRLVAVGSLRAAVCAHADSAAVTAIIVTSMRYFSLAPCNYQLRHCRFPVQTHLNLTGAVICLLRPVAQRERNTPQASH